MLTPKQTRFADEYLVDCNATQAAIRAGYSEKTAYSIGQENLTKPEVAEAIAERQRARQERTQLSADKVLSDLEAIKQVAMHIVADRDGNKTMVNFSAALRACELQGKHLGMFVPKFTDDDDEDPYFDPNPEV